MVLHTILWHGMTWHGTAGPASIYGRRRLVCIMHNVWVWVTHTDTFIYKEFCWKTSRWQLAPRTSSTPATKARLFCIFTFFMKRRFSDAFASTGDILLRLGETTSFPINRHQVIPAAAITPDSSTFGVWNTLKKQQQQQKLNFILLRSAFRAFHGVSTNEKMENEKRKILFTLFLHNVFTQKIDALNCIHRMAFIRAYCEQATAARHWSGSMHCIRRWRAAHSEPCKMQIVLYRI